MTLDPDTAALLEQSYTASPPDVTRPTAADVRAWIMEMTPEVTPIPAGDVVEEIITGPDGPNAREGNPKSRTGFAQSGVSLSASGDLFVARARDFPEGLFVQCSFRDALKS